MVTMEEYRHCRLAPDDRLKQIWPGFVWIEMKAGSATPLGQRLKPLYNYPAPAWEIEIPNWPRGVPTAANVWWTRDEPSTAGVLRRGEHYSVDPLRGTDAAQVDANIDARTRGCVRVV